jgi:hypothetical protein
VYTSQGLHKRYRIGVVDLCTSKSDRVIIEFLRVTREFCKECRFHVFGAKLAAVAKAVKMYYLKHGDSFDTFSWTFTRSGVYVNRRGWQRYSAESREEREFLFKQYLKRIAKTFIQR